MILQSDIARLGFEPRPNESQGPYLKLVSRVLCEGRPNHAVLLSDSTTQWKRLVICQYITSYERKDEHEYEQIFKGELDSPADLLRLFKMLKIPLPTNIK